MTDNPLKGKAKDINLVTRPRKRDRKRPDVIADALKDYIAQKRLRPGDRLPQEAELIALLGASKGTVREALKSMETQGLIATRTGPGGGAFIDTVSEGRAVELLGNYFFFKNLSIRDIYELRILLEPEMAAACIGRMSEADFLRLEEVMTYYASQPRTIEDAHRQRIKELEFHLVLVDLCPNPLLAFVCRFMIDLLMNLTVCKKIYDQPNTELRETGRNYQFRLIEALRNADGETARAVTYQHMCAAQRLMEEQEAEVENRFLRAGNIDLPRDVPPSAELQALSSIVTKH
ncbi:FadR/GntR family transcriptional regulator [Thalassospira australica]|uniref:FadR/GntR family transcriptional regulator n=1 Tax=Thalassospira australica TaxID=1528106 RepID=UPI00384F1F08